MPITACVNVFADSAEGVYGADILAATDAFFG